MNLAEIGRARLAIKYIFIEILPSFLLGVLVFVSILLMFQALRLTEFVLVHGVKVETVVTIMGYLAVSFLPVILPMSLLFSILLTYGRMSADSEVVAFKSLGLNTFHLSLPAVLLGTLTLLISAQTSFYLAPWGNRKFEVLINELGRLKAGATIKEGVFSEGYFDMVVYANSVDSKAGLLNKVFIYDERDPKAPMTIIAREGQIVRESDPRLGDSAQLRLIDGNIHKTQGDTYTKIDFKSAEISLFEPVDQTEKNKSMPSLNMDELKERLQTPDLDSKTRTKYQIEYHRRWSLPVACLIFAFLGVGLGTTTNRRAARASGMVLSLLVIVSYWILYIAAEGIARSEALPAAVTLWTINIVFAGAAYWSLKQTA